MQKQKLGLIKNLYLLRIGLLIQQLTEEQEKIHREHEDLNRKKQETMRPQEQLEVLLTCLDELKVSTGSESFRGDIFAKTIEQGIIYNNQKVTFKFKCGIYRTTTGQKSS